MDHAQFPWRPLGELLVEEGFLTGAELDRALTEQRRTGRLLGQILVAQGCMTALELARALARQHGVEVRPAGESQPEAVSGDLDTISQNPRPWRSLGTLLVLNGLVTETVLQEALVEKRAHTNRRLGEILVERGELSAADLASTLAEQHGLSLDAPMVAASSEPTSPEGPTYRVCAVDYKPAGEQRTALFETSNLLDAADFACDYVDREEPAGVEIERRDAGGSETVWTYSRERAEAAAGSSKALVETFGFDPTRWSVGS